MSGGPTIGIDLPEGTYTFASLAKRTGIPASTLRRWHREGVLPEYATTEYGTLTVYVFDEKSAALALLLRKGGGKLDVEDAT